jgi:biopolymer transport protein ExbD
VLVEGRDAKDAQGRPVTFDLTDQASRGRLAAFIQHVSGDRRVLVKADRELPFRHVNDLLQICREGGAAEVAAVTREERTAGKGNS